MCERVGRSAGTGGGLGLSIAYQIIAKHDGRIELFDTSDEGTTLAIHLPLDEAGSDG